MFSRTKRSAEPQPQSSEMVMVDRKQFYELIARVVVAELTVELQKIDWAAEIKSDDK